MRRLAIHAAALLAMTAALAAPEIDIDIDTEALSQDGHSSSVVSVNLSRDVEIAAGEVHNDDLIVVGGSATILGEVRGDVVVVNGGLELDGRVKGDVVSILSDTSVGDRARIGGDLVHFGGDFEVSPEAKIGGETVHADLSSLAFGEGARAAAGGFLGVLYLMKVLFFAILFWAMLIIVGVAPRRVTAAGEDLGRIWGRALFVGLLGYAAYAVLFTVFAFLCLVLIGFPLLALLSVAWFVTKAMGLAAILWLAGDRLSRNFLRRDVTPLVAFLIGFALYLPTQVLPFQLGLLWLTLSVLGEVLRICLTVLAVGLVLVTQFGVSNPFWAGSATPSPAASPPAPAPDRAPSGL